MLEHRRSWNRQTLRGSPPRLVPTGSLDKVLLTGGKNLSVFQSVGLLVFAVLGLGVGILLVRVDGVWFVMWGCALSLWGLVMLFNGSKALIRAIQKGHDQPG